MLSRSLSYKKIVQGERMVLFCRW